jgi:hypothetical protein
MLQPSLPHKWVVVCANLEWLAVQIVTKLITHCPLHWLELPFCICVMLFAQGQHTAGIFQDVLSLAAISCSRVASIDCCDTLASTTVERAG